MSKHLTETNACFPLQACEARIVCLVLQMRRLRLTVEMTGPGLNSGTCQGQTQVWLMSTHTLLIPWGAPGKAGEQAGNGRDRPSHWQGSVLGDQPQPRPSGCEGLELRCPSPMPEPGGTFSGTSSGFSPGDKGANPAQPCRTRSRQSSPRRAGTPRRDTRPAIGRAHPRSQVGGVPWKKEEKRHQG